MPTDSPDLETNDTENEHQDDSLEGDELDEQEQLPDPAGSQTPTGDGIPPGQEDRSSPAQDTKNGVPPEEGPAAAEDDAGTSVLPMPSWQSFVLIGGIMLIGLALVSQGAKYYFQWRASALTDEFTLAPPKTKSTPPAAAEIARSTPTECQFIPAGEAQTYVFKQRAQAVEFGDGHRRAAIEFGSYFFSNVVILGVFGLISLISVAVIAKTGLDKANGNVIAIFLLATATGIVYQGFFGVFQQKANIDSNVSQAIPYAQIVSKIDTYCATGKVAISDPTTYVAYLGKKSALVSAAAAAKAAAGVTAKPGAKKTEIEPPKSEEPDAFFAEVDPATFILYIDWHLEDRRKFAIAFDDKLVPSLTDPNRLSLKEF